MEYEMSRACSTCGEDEKCIQNFGWKTKGKRQLRRPGPRWYDSIRIDVRETSYKGVD